MLIEKNKVVTLHYRLTEIGQDVIEDSYDGDPVVFLHGHGSMLKGLEEAMISKQKDDQLTITLSPEQAYGPVKENAYQRVSLKHIVASSKSPSKKYANKHIKYKPGMVVQVNAAEGPREVVIVKVGLKNVDVDVNHPLAGKTLTFDVKIIDVRNASEEEIAHGHVHGKGGHQH